MIEDQEIARRIASFPIWHYDFDLQGRRTNPDHAEWDRARYEYFMEPVIRHYGGSLAGRRVLDLGCNAGFFSLKAIEAGCDFVLGIDGRQMHIDQASLVFEVKQVDPSRYRFACANILDFDYRTTGAFDLVLCLGILYHVNQPISLFETIAPVNSDLLVIDTELSTARGSMLELRRENPAGHLNAVGDELVMVPTAKAVMSMAELFGYRVRLLSLPSDDRPVWGRHLYGLFQAFVCAKQSDLSSDSAFRFRSLKSLYRDHDQWNKFARSHTKQEQKEAVRALTSFDRRVTRKTRDRERERLRPRSRSFRRIRLPSFLRARLQRLRRTRAGSRRS